MLRAAQIRAARALLVWRQEDLSQLWIRAVSEPPQTVHVCARTGGGYFQRCLDSHRLLTRSDAGRERTVPIICRRVGGVARSSVRGTEVTARQVATC